MRQPKGRGKGERERVEAGRGGGQILLFLDKTITKARIRPVVMVKGSPELFLKQSYKSMEIRQEEGTQDDFNHN